MKSQLRKSFQNIHLRIDSLRLKDFFQLDLRNSLILSEHLLFLRFQYQQFHFAVPNYQVF